MGLAALSAFVLPRSWTAPGRGLFQPLALLQWPMSWLAGKTGRTVEPAAAEALPPEQARELRAENARLQRQVLQQRLALQQAEGRVEELSGIADQMPDSHVGILIAPVVACDASPRHSTLLIAKGQQRRWVQEGEWVVAGGAGAPDWDAEATVRDLLHRGWLIGRVSEVQPRVARVQLATDPRFKTEVWAARMLADGTVQLAGKPCHLQGVGAGRMSITQAVEDYFKTDYRLVVVPTSRDLPVPLTVGRIAGSTPRADSSQHFNLSVLPWGSADKLSHVFVLVTEP
jgi:cell shape-determining protein MreC